MTLALWFVAGAILGFLFATVDVVDRVYLRTWSGSYVPATPRIVPRWALGWARHLLETARPILAILVAAILLVIVAGCASSQLLPIQCPESGRTYCPAQHYPCYGDSACLARGRR